MKRRLGAVLLATLALAPLAARAQTRIEAPGGVAAQSITNSPITIYQSDPAAVALARQADQANGDRRAAEKQAAALAKKLNLANVTAQTVLGFVRVLAQQPNLSTADIPAKMAEITAQYLNMQERLKALSPDDPAAADLAKQAAAAAQAGRFDEADRLLQEAESKELTAIDAHRRKAGELRASRGDNAATQLKHAEAAQDYTAAAAEFPDSALYQQYYYLVLAGDQWQVAGNSGAALTTYQASLKAMERLAQSDPGNAPWQRELAVSDERMGDIEQAQGDLAAALRSYQASLGIMERLAKSDPGNAGWQRDLSVSYESVGDVQQAQGDLPAALTSYQASLTIMERLAKSDPGNAGWQRDLSVSWDKIAFLDIKSGRRAEALDYLQRARTLTAELAKQSPTTAVLRRDLEWIDAQILALGK
jgi:tetratricopeptide (TPR) repeat protein